MILALLALACQPTSRCDDQPGGGSGQNFLVILTDDIGVDNTAAYGAHPDPPSTPHIDALAAAGVRFHTAWASPTCSPSRASLLTGRLPSRHGIGSWLKTRGESARLEPTELTLPEILRFSPHDYVSAAVGKWHLTTFDQPSPALHPLESGFTCHAGSLGNPHDHLADEDLAEGYRLWEKAVDGQVGWSDTYMLTDTTDEALARVAHTREPWLLYVAYNGAHEPVHVPPDGLYTGQVNSDSPARDKYRAMVEATDSEIGRLLAGIPAEVLERTTVVYASDNGTPKHGISEPFDSRRHKGTVYEGGVRVPLVVAGPAVSEPGSESLALVHLVDLLPTIAELAEVDLEAVLADAGVRIDGQSLVPWIEEPGAEGGRQLLYSEGFWPNDAQPRERHLRAIRDQEWKLIRSETEGEVEEQLFHFEVGAWDEGPDLLRRAPGPAEQAALERLREDLALVMADLAESSAAP